ncbi:MAG: hypothetical protein ACT4OO_15760 [Nitrospiraceae bacterium]
MPKLISAKRAEGHVDKAHDYVKAYIVFPSGLLGLIFMVAGTAALGYQVTATDTYTSATFVQSTGLLMLGGLFGWIQTRYHKYLLREHPSVFAARLRTFTRTNRAKWKKEPVLSKAAFRQRWIVPAYLAGILILVAASSASAMMGQVYYVAAYLMPWAGFFWARLFFWRALLQKVKEAS